MKCWNCLLENGRSAHRCRQCDQPLTPNGAQTVSSKKSLDYLLSEIENWSFLDDADKAKIRSVYTIRLSRLANSDSRESAKWPVSDWEGDATPSIAVEPEKTPSAPNVPLPEVAMATAVEKPSAPPTQAPEALPLQEESSLEEFSSQPTLTDRSESLVNALVGEADIRWFHSLGALLVVAAVVGWLRASWDSYGRLLAGLLIASSPLLLHFISHKLKKTVPLSSRLLAILANVLTPPALLALDVFGALPEFIPGKVYWTFALLVSAAVLTWQAEKTHEKVPLFIGALCAVMAGWSQGALLTALCSLAVGFLFAWDTESDDPEWAALRKNVSFYAGSFGAIATLVLFETQSNPLVPLSAFTAALVFLHFPTLVDRATQPTGTRLFMQTSLTLLGGIMMRASLDVPASGVALYLLFATGLFLLAKPDSQLAASTVKLASVMGLFALFIGFLTDLPSVITAQQSLHQVALRFVFAALSCVFFVHTSRRNGEDRSLFSLGLLSLLGGWLHLGLYAVTRQPLSHIDQALPLVASIPVLGALLLLGSRFLRAHEQGVLHVFLVPVSTVSLGCAALIGVLSAQEVPWGGVLLFHATLTLAWERGWLQKAREEAPAEVLPWLPRLTVAGLSAVILTLSTLSFSLTLVSLSGLLAVGALLLTKDYGRACFEFGWLAVWTLLPFGDPQSLLLSGLISFLLSGVDSKFKSAALAASTIYSLIVLLLHSSALLPWMLPLPLLAFVLASVAPTRHGEPWVPGQVRLGFDALLTVTILLSPTPAGGTIQSIALCLVLAGLAALFARFHSTAPLSKFLSLHSGGVLFATVFWWSLWQSTIETGLLLAIAGAATYAFIPVKHKHEVANALLILGAAQLASTTHFLLDPIVIGIAVISSEMVSLVRKQPSTHLSNFALLLIASTQGVHSVIAAEFSSEVLLAASLTLALRCVQQDFMYSAATSAALFLWKVDPYLSHGIDFKLRVLPTAFTFLGCAVWKWRQNTGWTRPALHIGLGLLVAPAFLQFAGGYQLWTNFVWLLVTGSAFLALSFACPEDFRLPLRQAGGYTLTGWVAISLTRAAMALPWQAGTLVIGLALVTVGVIVERKNRKAAPESVSTDDIELLEATAE